MTGLKRSSWAVTPLLLTACLAAPDKSREVTNDEGDEVAAATQALNGYWNGEFDGVSGLRMLIYNGNVYGVDSSRGYYGTVTFASAEQTALLALQSYSLNAGSEADAEQLLADGTNQDYDFDLQLTSVSSSNDTLVGAFAVNSSTSGRVQLTDDGSWSNNSSIGRLTPVGKWTAEGYELFLSRASNTSATFTGLGISESNSGCNFRGTLSTVNTSNNLYMASLTDRDSCAGDDVDSDTPMSGYAGINSAGELEFYLRDDDRLLFMTFAAPTRGDDSSGDDSSGDDSSGDDSSGDDSSGDDSSTA